MTKIAVCSLAGFVLFSLVGAAGAGVLSGAAVDANGAAIGGAYVFVYDNQLHAASASSLPGRSVITQANGSFALDLAPGFYDVCVFSSGFTASCKKVLMYVANRSNYRVRLVVDPLVLKERGDRFPRR